MTDKTVTLRKARQRERDRAAGFIEITVKVPADKADQVKALAARLRDEASAIGSP